MEASDQTASETTSGNGASQSPWAAHEAADTVGRPEVPVVGAFVGGLILAKLLKAIGGGDD